MKKTSTFLNILRDQNSLHSSKRSLFNLFWRKHRKNLLFSAVLFICHSITVIISPVVFFFFLEWTEDDVSSSNYAWKGIGFCIVLAFSSFTSQYFEHAFHHRITEIGIEVSDECRNMVLEKLLAQKMASKSSSGAISNYFTTDSELYHLFQAYFNIILQPLEVLCIVAIMYVFVGISIFGGLGVVILSFIFSTLGSIYVGMYASQRSSSADDRMLTVTEMLWSMKSVKLYGWENNFKKSIESARDQETLASKRSAPFFGLTNTSASNSIDVISLVIIVVFGVASKNVVSAKHIFSMFAFLSILHGRIFHFPESLREYRSSMNSLKRLEEYLTTPELVDKRIPLPDSSDVVFCLKECSFAWTTDIPPILSNINVSLPRGESLGVIGKVASGKSSFLLGLLGELNIVSGNCSILLDPVSSDCPSTSLDAAGFLIRRPRVAYVPQSAFIVHGTIRDNILFGRPYDDARYKQTIFSCALLRDFELLSHGDLTDVSSCTLSGGQKQRVSLARAVYSNAELYLFDDVLSALDGKVAAHVTEHVLSKRGMLCNPTGTLSASTIVLVSNAPRALSEMSQIMLLDGGVAILGSAEDMLLREDLRELVGGAGSVDDSLDLVDENNRIEEVSHTAHNESKSSSVLSTNKTTDDVAMSVIVQTPSDPSLSSLMSAPGVGFVRAWTTSVGGTFTAIFALFLLILEAGAIESSVLVLSYWTADSSANDIKTAVPSDFYLYLILYASFIALEIVSAYIRQVVYVYGVTNGTNHLHHSLLSRLCTAPTSFFDRTPSSNSVAKLGRDLDRFTQDFFLNAEYFFQAFVHFIMVGVVEVITTPYMLLIIIPTYISLWYILASEKSRSSPEVLLKKEQHRLQMEQESKVSAISFKSSVHASRNIDNKLISSESDANNLDITNKSVPSSLFEHTVAAMEAAPLRLYPLPDIPHYNDLESFSRVPMTENFQSALDGAAALRALGASDLIMHFHELSADLYCRSQRLLHSATGLKVLFANMFGSINYSLTSFLIVPLRIYGVLNSSDAGFLLANACFSALLTNMLIQHFEVLENLRLLRGRILRWLMDIPSEALAYDTEEARIATAESVRPHFSAAREMVPRAQRSTFDRLFREKYFFYSDSAPESFSALNRAPSPPNWPSRGEITLQNVQMRYAPTMPLVLKDLSVNIEAGSKVAVVGRSGAGKSSLLAALTRLCEPCGGRVCIDGVDLSSLQLHALRTAVAVISQDPLFFSGSLRKNLDPFDEFSDAQLLDALARVHLLDYVQEQQKSSSCPSGAAEVSVNPLDFFVEERGGNFSLGQLQLLALARAVFRQPRVVCLDEATASLDLSTEAMVVDAVYSAFSTATVVQIAHRLVSTVGVDNVIVMAAGKLEEFGPPEWLICGDDGLVGSFNKSVGTSGDIVDNGCSKYVRKDSWIRTGHFLSMVESMPPVLREEFISKVKLKVSSELKLD